MRIYDRDHYIVRQTDTMQRAHLGEWREITSKLICGSEVIRVHAMRIDFRYSRRFVTTCSVCSPEIDDIRRVYDANVVGCSERVGILRRVWAYILVILFWPTYVDVIDGNLYRKSTIFHCQLMVDGIAIWFHIIPLRNLISM
jgi:hypothetical protein